MSNPFSINVVTPAGSALIAQATAANQIVFTGAKSATTAATDAEDLAGKDISFYDGSDGTIDACSATNNVAKIVSRFGNTSGSTQIVKAVCILGRLANQTDAQAVIVAAMSDDASEIYLPSSASPTQIIRFPFNITIDADEDIETAYADGATIADLARFVSMYKAGDPTQGEDQQIKGIKEFNGEVIFDDEATFGNRAVFDDEASFSTATFNNTADFQSGFSLTDGDTGPVTVSVTRSTRTDAYITFPSGETGHLHILYATVDCYGDVTVEGGLHVDGAIETYSTASIQQGATIGLSGATGTSLTVHGNATVSGTISSTYVSANSVTTSDLSVDELTATDGTTTTRLDKTGFSTGDGTHSAGFGANGVGSVSGTMYVGSLDSSGNISASSGSIFGELSVGGVTGLAPTLDTSASPQVVRVPIGGIVFVWSGDLPGSITAGQTNRFAASALRVCVWDAASGAWSVDTRYAQAGLYAALASYGYSASAQGDTAFPLMRISD